MTLSATVSAVKLQIPIARSSDIPAPKFAFNQRVQCKHGEGIIRGLEYMNQETADIHNFDGVGWWYIILLDEDNPAYQQTPTVNSAEDEITSLQTPKSDVKAFYLWHLSRSYRGYVVVPIQEGDTYRVGVFNPVGDALNLPTEQVERTQRVWLQGQDAIDQDIEASTWHSDPRLIAHLTSAAYIRGQRRFDTLKYELHSLIERCTLPEVLDRLAESVFEQSRCEKDEPTKRAWMNLEIQIQKATEVALLAVNLKAEQRLDLWG
jgi:hypothetical protein